eukprot:scaffold347_cov239-Pinguiococcus_pyrenoidosus.AAC.34
MTRLQGSRRGVKRQRSDGAARRVAGRNVRGTDADGLLGPQDTRFSRSPALQRMLGGQEEVALGLSSQVRPWWRNRRHSGSGSEPRRRGNDPTACVSRRFSRGETSAATHPTPPRRPE